MTFNHFSTDVPTLHYGCLLKRSTGKGIPNVREYATEFLRNLKNAFSPQIGGMKKLMVLSEGAPQELSNEWSRQ
jgi:hypothetical protein